MILFGQGQDVNNVSVQFWEEVIPICCNRRSLLIEIATRKSPECCDALKRNGMFL
jgi:hypothetical protein